MALKKIQLRRDLSANWTTNNPILGAGEVGIELPGDSGRVRFKIGDGETSWTSLSYVEQDLTSYLTTTEAASTYLTKTDASANYLGKTAKAVSATTADTATKATQDGSGNVITTTYQGKNIYFNDKVASTWVDDATYPDFPLRCDISCAGVTSSMYAEVVFNVEEAQSGNYAPVCETKDNGIVSIWSSTNDSITIPTIKVSK